MFITNERPIGYQDLNIDGVIGISPCPPQPTVNASTNQSAFYDYSFFLKLHEKLNSIRDITWDMNNTLKNGTANNVGTGFLMFNFRQDYFPPMKKLNDDSIELYNLNNIF